MCTLFNAQVLNKHMHTILHATLNAMRDGACGAGIRRGLFIKEQYKTAVLWRMSLNSWLVKNLQYVPSTFELFIVLLSLSLLLWWADFFAFFLTVASRRLHSPLIYAPGSANTYVVKGQPHCPPRPPSPRNVIPMSSYNARLQYPARAWAQIYPPSVTSIWYS